jgi:biotin-[acetyl-CoA-carboxylase] ligase BirA-like protein
MIVYADDISYAKKIFPNFKSWKNNTLNSIVASDIPIVKNLLNTKSFYNTEITFNSNWHYSFLTKNTQQSQFDLLYELSKNNVNFPDGILCLADSGTNFHGYRNREWKTQSGNLHLSVLKKPGKTISNFHVGFTILAAISVIQTLDMIPEMQTKAGIKWVNDILIDNSKISGVITQTQSQKDIVTAVVLGIGLNIEKAPKIKTDAFVQKSTCIYEYITKNNEYGISEIFKILMDKLSENYNKLLRGEYKNLLEFYKKRSIILGRQVEIYADSVQGDNTLIVKGKVEDIGNDLELYISGYNNPIRNGRLVLLK